MQRVREITLQDLERPLGVSKVGDTNHSAPASVDLCQGSQLRLRKGDG